MLSKNRLDQIYEAFGNINKAFDAINNIVKAITDDSEACCLLLQEVCRGTASICGLCAGKWKNILFGKGEEK